MPQCDDPIIGPVWVTKYALTQGVTRHKQVRLCSDKMIEIIGCRYPTCFHKPDWHLVETDAINRVEVMRAAAIKSARKKLTSVEQVNPAEIVKKAK